MNRANAKKVTYGNHWDFLSAWLSIIIGVVLVAVSIILRRTLVVQEHSHIRQIIELRAKDLKTNTERLLESQAQALTRMARRWERRGETTKEEWESDVRLYVNQHSFYQAIEWADSSFHVRWIVPLEGNEEAQNLNLAFEERRRIALEKARDSREITVTHAIDLVQGEKGFLVNLPIYPGKNFDGFILGVFRINKLFSSILTDKDLSRFSFAVFDDEEEVYSQGNDNRENMAKWSIEKEIKFYNIALRILVWPREELFVELQSIVPEIALITGIFMSLFIALAVYFFQKASFRTKEIEILNRNLFHEVIERRHAEAMLQKAHNELEVRVKERTAELTEVNKALEREITERKQTADEIYLLREMILDISNSKDLHDALVITMQKVCDITGWVYGEAWKLSSNGTHLLRNRAMYSTIKGLEKFIASTEGMSFPMGKGLPGKAWKTKQPVWVYDVADDPEYLRRQIAGETGIKTGIAFPVIANDEVVTAIVFYQVKLEERNERLVRLVSAVVTQLGPVIKRKQAEDALRESEERLRAILDNATSLIYMKDIQGRYLFINRQFQKLFPSSTNEIKYKTDKDLYPEKLADAFQANDRKVLEAKIAFEFDELVPQKDGLHNYLSIKFPLFDSTGAVYAICGISTDITERKRMEEILFNIAEGVVAKIGKAFFQSLVLQIAEMLNIDYVMVSKLIHEGNELETIALYAHGAILDNVVYPFVGTPDEKVLEKGLLTYYENPQQQFPKDHSLGEMGVKSYMGIPLTDSNKHPLGLLVIMGKKELKEVEIAGSLLKIFAGRASAELERERAEKTLQESEPRLSEAQQIARIGSWEWDIIKNKMCYSDAVYCIFGLSSQEFGDTYDAFLDRIHPDDSAFVRESIDKALSERKPYDIKYRITLKDNTIRFIHEKVVVLFDNMGIRPVRMVGTIQDISEIKQAEEEQSRLREQLERVSKLESIGKLAGGIAHDFNNILTVISGYGQLLNKELKGDDPFKAYVEKIVTSADRAAQLTQGLLAFGRKQISDQKPVEINELMKSSECLMRRLLGEDIELTISLTDKKCIVMADSGQIEQVMMNLATNARDAMPHGGEIIIHTNIIELDNEYRKTHGYGETGKYVLLSFSDTGEGMDEETRKRIFEPYFTTKDVGKGTGLGLSIVYGIVKQHNGYINAYSEPGKGTSFKIYLPLIESAVEKKRRETHTLTAGGTETILMAEDELEVRNLVKTVLEGNGYKVIEATDGEDAIKKFTEHKDEINLLIFDVVMPKKSGKDAYDTIRKVKPEVKTLFMSGYSEDIIHKRGFVIEKGLTYVSKPILPTELLKIVRELLDKPFGRDP